MKIDVRLRALEPSAALRDHALRQVHFHLSRFGAQITAIEVRLGDVNGPKGGVDKRCHVTVRGPRIAILMVYGLSADAYSAIDIAVERAAHAVGRNLERARTTRSAQPSPRRAS